MGNDVYLQQHSIYGSRGVSAIATRIDSPIYTQLENSPIMCVDKHFNNSTSSVYSTMTSLSAAPLPISDSSFYAVKRQGNAFIICDSEHAFLNFNL
jgi:hypothetical protein